MLLNLSRKDVEQDQLRSHTTPTHSISDIFRKACNKTEDTGMALAQGWDAQLENSALLHGVRTRVCATSRHFQIVSELFNTSADPRGGRFPGPPQTCAHTVTQFTNVSRKFGLPPRLGAPLLDAPPKFLQTSRQYPLRPSIESASSVLEAGSRDLLHNSGEQTIDIACPDL